jgi:hypothetical protein
MTPANRGRPDPESESARRAAASLRRAAASRGDVVTSRAQRTCVVPSVQRDDDLATTQRSSQALAGIPGISEFYAVDGRQPSAEDVTAADVAEARRQHDDYARALQHELDMISQRLDRAREGLHDAVAAQRRAVDDWEKGAATERVVEAGRKASTLEQRVEHIKSAISQHRKSKP